MKTEQVRYESGQTIYAFTLTEATNRISMERMAAIRDALQESEAAGNDPKAYALADRHLVFAAMVYVIVEASVDGRPIVCPMSFEAFLDLPQQLTDVVLAEVNRRLNPQWFESAESGDNARKKAAASTAA